MDGKKIRIYRNDEVEGVIAGIPRGHYHLRMAIVLKDQVIVLHEATVAAIVRAYVDIVTHPTRRAVAMVKRTVDKTKKHGYASVQQVDADVDEDNVLDIIEKMLEVSKA
ncbi:hypothetical protein J4526_09545 [Desulfurococcaceae archaeon MEX13E-LK6-19]|nr:hypothetical protein J4526_09545 [Desulfurococcaceae archaeon MEX13E-LK6-19]